MPEEQVINTSEVDFSKNVFKKGLVFKREEVGGKTRYSYTIFLDFDPTDTSNLKAISYAKEQLENIIVGLKVENKILDYKKEELNQ